ncbi:hypothetical protein H3221_021480 [Pseudomonas sp. LMG 31766]|uniref:hypothetical protein n=1 Tax=Pseudomonas chaetocerotis TaxID=2758695 RepID=UPI001CCCF29C|nr:hypothetical protein [Pseudomonas chaetocerotis]MBZ9667316.1 hypothetical protein [Pseudomonas chaetocerotis]
MLASPAWAHGPEGIHSEGGQVEATFDLVHTRVFKEGRDLVFEQLVDGQAGSRLPTAKGSFAGAEVYSYVWPTSLDSGSVRFEQESGILAPALTSPPDFDDTPAARWATHPQRSNGAIPAIAARLIPPMVRRQGAGFG